MLRRPSPFVVRIARQQARFGLPMLPTTTIGSFPQTARRARCTGSVAGGQDDATATTTRFSRTETRRCIEKQEELGLDVLVHGEFERNDMVEYFGEQLEGFAFTENGWVQSYGSRCVKPPVLFGDVLAPATDDGRVVALRAVADQAADERDAHRAGDDPAVVVRAGRPAAQRDVQADRPRAARRGERISRPRASR